MLYEMGLTHIGADTIEEFCHSLLGQYFKTTCNALNEEYSSNYHFQPVSLKVIMQYLQNSEVGKFQEFIPIDEWRDGKRESKPIDVSNINKIPIELFSHVNDEACLGTLTLEHQISSPVKLHAFSDPAP